MFASLIWLHTNIKNLFTQAKKVKHILNNSISNMINLEYETTARVLDTWDTARRLISDEELGHLILDRFLELEPNAEPVLMDVKKHGDNIVPLFDTLFQLLGPDLEFLEEICQQVGERHKKMGVEKSFFPKMGLGLLHGLEKALGNDLTDEDKDAWRDVYKKISDEIITAMT